MLHFRSSFKPSLKKQQKEHGWEDAKIAAWGGRLSTELSQKVVCKVICDREQEKPIAFAGSSGLMNFHIWP